MTIFPAIDLYEGKVVRLVRGDYGQMTVYGNDPVATARSFKDSGATAVHVVDLEGARDGKPANFEVIKRIVSETGLEVQAGGGIRAEDVVANYLGIGVRRVILGTAAVSTPGFLRSMALAYGDAIAVAADIRDGFVAVKGWAELSDKDVFDFCRAVEDMGAGTLICTDISKDGLLGGSNIDLYKTLREELSIKLIASGGITSPDEIIALKALAIDGVILGKALYSGRIMLKDALEAGRRIAI